MQFQVPQFIEIEDKIVGPLTLKQFLYIAGNVGIGYVCYSLIPITAIGAVLAIGFISFGLILAFYKFNNRPFVNIVSASFFYIINPRLYIWKPHKKDVTNARVIDMSRYRVTKHTTQEVFIPSSSLLTEMNWKVGME